jgi:hypothetical protein
MSFRMHSTLLFSGLYGSGFVGVKLPELPLSLSIRKAKERNHEKQSFAEKNY